MRVSEKLAYILEDGGKLGLWRGILKSGCTCVNFVHPVGSDLSQEASPATGPFNFDLHLIGESPRREDPHRFIAREVPAAADHFLALLWHGSAVYRQLGPDPTRIRGQAL